MQMLKIWLNSLITNLPHLLMIELSGLSAGIVFSLTYRDVSDAIARFKTGHHLNK